MNPSPAEHCCSPSAQEAIELSEDTQRSLIRDALPEAAPSWSSLPCGQLLG